MKLLALCIICGFLATKSVAQRAIEKDTDESSDYSDLFGDVVKGMQSFLGNAIDDSDSDSYTDSDSKESNSDSDKNSNEDKNDNGILQTLNGEKHDDDNDDDDDDSSEEFDNILNAVDSLFDGTLLKLETFGEEGVNEFWQNLRDLIDAIADSEEIEENGKQPFKAEVQQTNPNSQNAEEEEHNTEKTTIVEKDTNGNNIAIGQHENTEAEISMKDNKQKDNNENTTSQKQTEIDENRLQEVAEAEAKKVDENENETA